MRATNTLPEKRANGNSSDVIRHLLLKVRILLLFFMVGLVVSGATAIPLETELQLLASLVDGKSEFGQWIFKIRNALVETNAQYPFVAYGTDWLAFASHFGDREDNINGSVPAICQLPSATRRYSRLKTCATRPTLDLIPSRLPRQFQKRDDAFFQFSR